MVDYNSMDDIKPSQSRACSRMRHIAEETPGTLHTDEPDVRADDRGCSAAVVNVRRVHRPFAICGATLRIRCTWNCFDIWPAHTRTRKLLRWTCRNADKQKRYANAGIELANLEFSSGDITQQNLAQCLDGRQAHIVVAEGLLIYLERQNIHELCQNLLPGMADGAHFIAEVVIASKEDLTTLGNIIRMMRRNTGSDVARGRVESKEQGIELFQTGGFVNTQAYLFEDLADKTQLTEPNRNLLLILDGEKG